MNRGIDNGRLFEIFPHKKEARFFGRLSAMFSLCFRSFEETCKNRVFQPPFSCADFVRPFGASRQTARALPRLIAEQEEQLAQMYRDNSLLQTQATSDSCTMQFLVEQCRELEHHLSDARSLMDVNRQRVDGQLVARRSQLAALQSVHETRDRELNEQLAEGREHKSMLAKEVKGLRTQVARARAERDMCASELAAIRAKLAAFAPFVDAASSADERRSNGKTGERAGDFALAAAAADGSADAEAAGTRSRSSSDAWRPSEQSTSSASSSSSTSAQPSLSSVAAHEIDDNRRGATIMRAESVRLPPRNSDSAAVAASAERRRQRAPASVSHPAASPSSASSSAAYSSLATLAIANSTLPSSSSSSFSSSFESVPESAPEPEPLRDTVRQLTAVQMREEMQRLAEFEREHAESAHNPFAF